MKATNNGSLTKIVKCKIEIPGAGTVELNNLPDITDSKSAVYNGEGIMGRSYPLYTYSHSADRNLSMQLHFFIVDAKIGEKQRDAEKNLSDLRKIKSAVYPREGARGSGPYLPPPVCVLECGDLLGSEPVCAVLQSYSVKFPTDVAWDESTYCPYRFDVDTAWLVVHTSTDLPYQSRIVKSGR